MVAQAKPAPPRRIRLLGKTFDVEFEDEGRLRETFSGEYSHRNLRITVSRSDWHEDQQRVGVLHEIVHGIDYFVNDGEYLTEQQVVYLAHGLFAVLRENPQLTAWLIHKDENRDETT